MYSQPYPIHKSSSPHPDYSHLAYPPPYPSKNLATTRTTLHPPHGYHDHHPGASSDLTPYSFDQPVHYSSERSNYSPHGHTPHGTYSNVNTSSMPHLIDPIPTLPTSSHVRAVNYSPHSKEPSSMMLEFTSELQINPTSENAYYTSTFNTGGLSSHGHGQRHPPRPAPSSLLHSLDYPLAPHLSVSAHHEIKTRSAYKVIEPTGRRKSETSTSQARRNSSSNNPYPRSRKEAAANHSMKSTSARNYDTLSVLSNDLGPIGPTNHILVPQDTVFGEPTSYNRYQEHLFQPISFRAQGFHELGVKLTQILKQRSDPIDGGDDHVFENSGYREIKVKIQWPGYPHHPFEKRVKTHNCAITRATVCLILANMVIDFVMMLKDRKVQVEKGYEGWAIGKGGYKANEFWITGLLHRGGNHFQPEIWVPQ